MKDELEGIIIRYQEYREHDAILHVLCRKRGIVHVNARGIQKVKSKNAPACQLFTHVRMQLPLQETRSIYTLRSAEIIEGYRHIREDLLKQSIAAYVCECIDASKFEEDVFEVVQTVLDILQETTHPIRILCLFQAIMNRMHGIEPYVDGCVRCGNQKAIYAISIRDGGFICHSCYSMEQDAMRSKEDLKVFRLLCKAHMEHYDILKSYQAFTYQNFEDLYAFFYEYAGISLKSVKFLKTIIAM